MTFRRLILASAVCVAPLFTACEGSPSTADAGTDAALTDAFALDARTDAHDDLGVDHVDAAGEDAGEDAGACVDDPTGPPVPVEVASRQTVTFHVTGSGYLGTRAGFSPCEVFSIDRGETNVPLVGAFQCLCECAPPGAPALLEYVALGEHDVVWDARELVSYTTAWDCAEHGWAGAGCQRQRHDVRQPVVAGHYTVRFPIDDELPSGCSAGSTPDTYVCDSATGPSEPSLSVNLCPSERYVEVEFDLPETGDIVVDVVVPPPDA